MDKDHIKRMYIEADKLIYDSGILSRNIDQKSDAASFIKILGFEILLKCALVINGLATTSWSLCVAIRLFWETREDTEHVM